MKAAVIGIGNMGKHHARVYSHLLNVKLVAVADLNETLGVATAKKYHTKFYKNYLEMIEIEHPDVISICVPTSVHYTVAKECLQRKFNILLEKPITTTLEEAKKLLAFAKKSKVKF